MKTRFLLFSILTLLFLFSARELSAFGIGLVGDFHGGAASWDGIKRDHLGGGGGLIIDTNVARDEVFNYRLDLTFGGLMISQDVVNSFPLPLFGTYIPFKYTETQKKTTLFISTVHYFGFGVVRNKYVRFWLGPQITLGGMATDVRGLITGIGLAMGLNINIGEFFTISLTGSGRFVAGFTVYDATEGGTNLAGGYGGDGMVTLSFIFRINDSYKAAR